MKSQKALRLLSLLGKSLPVTSQTKKDMEKFTTKYVYKDKTSKTLAEARSKKWGAMKKKYTVKIPLTLIPIIWKYQGQLSDIHHVELYGLWCLPITSSAWLELANGQIFANKTYKTSITKWLPQRLVNMQANDTVADTDSESDSGSDSDSASDGYNTEYE